MCAGDGGDSCDALGPAAGRAEATRGGLLGIGVERAYQEGSDDPGGVLRSLEP